MIVPAGAVNEKKSQWRCKTEDYLGHLEKYAFAEDQRP
jgi:hypothetical protein